MTQADLFEEGPTLANARAEVMAKLPEGTTCPCCDQYARMYRRKLSSSMAAGLIDLCRLRQRRGIWIHVRDIRIAGVDARAVGGTIATMRHWGLVRQMDANSDGSKRCSGYWRPTTLGGAFVEEALTVPSYVLLYNNQKRGSDGDQITIRQALGSRFDYAELMAWRGGR